MKNPESSPPQTASLDSSKEESFLRRWSKRKLDASNNNEQREEKALKEEQPLKPVEEKSEASSYNPASDQTKLELTDEDMPPLESLDENSDYSGFFSPRVSESLRKQALRKLFHFQQFNITDDLNDYDEDYTQFEKLGNVVTHEMKRLLDSENDKLAANQATAITDTGSVESTEGAEDLECVESTENMEPSEHSKPVTEENVI